MTLSLPPAVAAAATFAAGALLSVAAAMWQAHANRAEAVARFQPLAHRAVEDIATRMRTYEYGLRGVRGATVVGGVDQLDGRGFLAYSRTRDSAREFPGARGFGVIRRVAEGSVASFVAAAKEGGRPDFALKTLGPQAGEHFVIFDFHPQSRGNVAIGLDISSEPNRRGAAVAAMRSGAATLTGPITLFRTEGQPLRSFLLLLPVYRPGLPDTTPAEREAAAVGWTFAPLVIDDVLQGFDGSEGRLALSLRDLDAGDASVFYNAPWLTPSTEIAIGESITLPIFGRRWHAQVEPTDEFVRRLGQTHASSVAVGGCALAALLAALVYLLALTLRRGRDLAALNAGLEREVAERTALLGTALQRAEASERFMREMSDRIPLRVAYLDTGRRYQFVNESHCVRFGRTREEIIGRTRQDIIDQPTPPEVLGHIDAALAGEPQRYEFVEDLGRGRTVIEAHLIPDRCEDGTVRGLYAVSSDISERKNAEHALRQTHALLRAVLDAASQASIIATRPDGIITVFNTGAERMLGCRASDVIGIETSLLFHDRDEMRARAHALSERLGQSLPTAMALIHPAVLDEAHDCTYIRRDGGRVPVELVVTAMRDEAGELFGYLGIAHDVSRQRHQEQSLRKAKQRAEDANRAKSQFLANMSHEIRTPMNAVIGLSYLLERTPLDADQTATLGKINLASKSLLSIINDILDLSKIEAGELSLEHTPFDLGALLRSVAGLMKVQADAKGIAFGVEVEARVPTVVRGDSTRLRQILMNLLSNAIKFTERGSVCLRVAPLLCAEDDARLRFSVQDSGIGIEPETMKTLFTPFVQADASTTRRFGGTGLGLSIVKQLAGLMEGQTGATSTPGQGSTFWVELELTPCATELLSAVEVAAVPSCRGLKGVRVLITDDNEVNLEVARRILELEGAEVTLAHNGREAVDRLTQRPDGWDVVLMDVQMPVLDGHAATREIRGVLGLTALPIIALTAASLSSEQQLAMDAGMNEVISKPFDPPELARCIRRVVGDRGAAASSAAVPAASEPGEGRPSWPVIEGIDAADAQRRLGGDADFFASLLGRMLAEYTGDEASAGRLDNTPLHDRSMRMHKLRGSASTLGATAVARLAAEAEDALRAGDIASADAVEARLATALRTLRAHASAALEAHRARAAAGGVAADPAAPLAQALPRLLELLHAFDLRAAEQFAALAPQLRARLGSIAHTRLADRIDKLEFGSAAELLEAVDI